MRIHVIFLMAWVLLCFARATDVLYEFGEYRLGTHMETALEVTPGGLPEDERNQVALREQTKVHLERGITALVEMLLLAVTCFCFFRILKKRVPSHSSSSNETERGVESSTAQAAP